VVSPSAVVVMARAPVPGTCKTRLCPPLLPAEAAGLYRSFLVDIARELEAWPSEVDLWLAWSGQDEDLDRLRLLFGDRWRLLRQRGASLTVRMEQVFDSLFDAGYRRVVMRNSDSPHLPAALLDQAFEAMGEGTMVLGPDRGGGYYLVGLDRRPQGLFPRTMSTGSVYEETAALARAAGLAVRTLPTFLDVDLPEELATLRSELADPRYADWATTRTLADPALVARLETST
jgi:uncharacterized protein